MYLNFNSINLTDIAESNAISTGFTQLTPQFWAMVWITLILIALSLFVWKIMRKADPTQPPTTGQLFIGGFVEGTNNYLSSLMDGKLKKTYPYLFTLLIILFFSAFISLFGFLPPSSSFMFTFALGFITFIGIFVAGITSQGLWRFIKGKYKNPLELFSQFGPLLSISIRLFGSTFALGVLFSAMPMVLESFGATSIATFWPIINILWFWIFKSIDIFLSLIQALVFVSLTGIYWSLEWNLSPKKAAAKEKKILEQTKHLDPELPNYYQDIQVKERLNFLKQNIEKVYIGRK